MKTPFMLSLTLRIEVDAIKYVKVKCKQPVSHVIET